MQLTDRFVQLVRQQLDSLGTAGCLSHIVLYAAQGQHHAAASLVMVDQWPASATPLPAAQADPSLQSPSPERRWYPLRDGNLLLGALRAERLTDQPWSRDLDQRLQASASAMAQCLSLDLERAQLVEQLQQQRLQLNLMVHQLRNPLAALRTYAQLLLRRLGPDNDHRALVENLLKEQGQLDRYVSALDRIGQPEMPVLNNTSTPLLLPPVHPDQPPITLQNLLAPLAERAAATAALQGRPWHGPEQWPTWMQQPRPGADAVVAEILANLMENAFRYSPSGAALGLLLLETGVCLWDGGPPIPPDERERIFERGIRGSSSQDRSGSGLGLALGRQLAEERGGTLVLAKHPADVDPTLPKQGNAFVITLPPRPTEGGSTPAAPG
ncbi:MAG: sensor histidine kinase [Synechococcus sp.]